MATWVARNGSTSLWWEIEWVKQEECEWVNHTHIHTHSLLSRRSTTRGVTSAGMRRHCGTTRGSSSSTRTTSASISKGRRSGLGLAFQDGVIGCRTETIICWSQISSPAASVWHQGGGAHVPWAVAVAAEAGAAAGTHGALRARPQMYGRQMGQAVSRQPNHPPPPPPPPPATPVRYIRAPRRGRAAAYRGGWGRAAAGERGAPAHRVRRDPPKPECGAVGARLPSRRCSRRRRARCVRRSATPPSSLSSPASAAGTRRGGTGINPRRGAPACRGVVRSNGVPTARIAAERMYAAVRDCPALWQSVAL